MTWQTKKLGEVCNVDYGTRVVRSRNIPGEFYVYGGGGKTFTSNEYNREDCVIVSRFAMSAYCVRKISGKFFLNDSGLSVSTKDQKVLLQDFVDKLLFASQDRIYSLGRGQAQRNLHIDEFKNLRIPLPPLSEQKKIVKMLDEKMGKIAEMKKLREASLADTEKILSQTLHEIFEEGKQKRWEEIYFGDEKYLKIIDGDRGKNYPTKMEFSRDGYCLFLSTSNVRKGNFDFSKMDFIKKEKDESLRKGKVSRGDLILTTRGTLGNSAYYDSTVPYKNIRINSGMVVLRTDQKKLLPQYLIYIINSDEFIKKTKEANSGSTQPQLPIKVLSKLSFLLPPITEQQKIVKRLDALSEKIKQSVELQKSQLEDLKKLEKSYLREAFLH